MNVNPLIEMIESRFRAIIREELEALAITPARPEPDEWISVTEFCIRTGRNPETARNTVYQRCASGEIPARKTGKSWEINWTEYCK